MNFSTAIMQINHPTHRGRPNPSHGKFFFVGSVPSSCYDHDRGKSLIYDTEQQAVEAATAGGAVYLQGADCRVIFKPAA